MAEQVTVTPIAGRSAKGDPGPAGTPFDVQALDVAPGNTMLRFGIGGDLKTVDFTVYLPLRIRIGADYFRTVEKLTDDFWITVRGRRYNGRHQEWSSGGRGVVAVLAHSATGKGGA